MCPEEDSNLYPEFSTTDLFEVVRAGVTGARTVSFTRSRVSPHLSPRRGYAPMLNRPVFTGLSLWFHRFAASPTSYVFECSRTLGLRAGSRPCSPSSLTRKRVHRRTGFNGFNAGKGHMSFMKNKDELNDLRQRRAWGRVSGYATEVAATWRWRDNNLYRKYTFLKHEKSLKRQK